MVEKPVNMKKFRNVGLLFDLKVLVIKSNFYCLISLLVHGSSALSINYLSESCKLFLELYDMLMGSLGFPESFWC